MSDPTDIAPIDGIDQRVVGLNRRLRRQAFLEQHGRYYLTGPAGSSGSGQGHPFRSKWAATKWAAVRSKISRQDWRVYRFDR